MAYSKKQIKEKFDYICDKIEAESVSLRSVLREDNMPDAVTFYKWLDNDESKIKQYARATEARAENIFEDILAIADNQEDDVYVTEEGIEVKNWNVIQRARLRVDSRKWMLGKMQPKKYSDKQYLDIDISKIKPIETIRKSDKK